MKHKAGIYEKYKPHQTSFTMSGTNSSNNGGRPITDTPSEKTVQSRSNHGNALPSPSDKK